MAGKNQKLKAFNTLRPITPFLLYFMNASALCKTNVMYVVLSSCSYNVFIMCSKLNH